VLQRTEPVGLGVCFESAAVEAPLAEAVARLCRNIGYFGAFEVEFLREGPRRLAIDFNPRFYGQMAFDVKRGLPLPFLVWLGACGLEDELRERVGDAAVDRSAPGTVYLSRFVFELLLLSRRATGRFSADQRRGWRSWQRENSKRAIDAAGERDDWLPGLVHVADELRRGPLAFLRMLRGG
jgi:D-aspartate ligase